jgi:glucose-6-phosphate 1-dehydrogenase
MSDIDALVIFGATGDLAKLERSRPWSGWSSGVGPCSTVETYVAVRLAAETWPGTDRNEP